MESGYRAPRGSDGTGAEQTEPTRHPTSSGDGYRGGGAGRLRRGRLDGRRAEVSLALEAASLLAGQGFSVRVVSLPSWDLFEVQDRDYQESVLPPSVSKRLAIEAGTTLGWDRYVGTEGDVIGIDGFGASAPHQAVAEHFGLTPESVAERAKALLLS